jgi:hypothetical protein
VRGRLDCKLGPFERPQDTCLQSNLSD